MNPVVSIIVPVYNAKEYLRRCVDSILGQEYTDFELLLIDDGSQDGSGAICDEYAAKDMRVRVIHKENGGVSAARNLAMKNARGTYLQFADSDDWITPDATKLLVRMAEEDGCDLVISDFYRVAGERVSQKGDIEEDGCMTREQFAAHMMENPADFYYGVLWNKLYRREIIEKHHLQMNAEISWCEDFMFNLEYIRFAERFCVLHAPVYYYVKRKGSLVSQGMSISNTMRMKINIFDYYNEFYKDIYDHEDYADIRLQVYSFLWAAAKDGAVPPAPLPGGRKLGAERRSLCREQVEGEGVLMDQYRYRQLLDYLLDLAAKKNRLTPDEAKVLFALYQCGEFESMRRLSEVADIPLTRLFLTLQKLERKKLIEMADDKTPDTIQEKGVKGKKKKGKKDKKTAADKREKRANKKREEEKKEKNRILLGPEAETVCEEFVQMEEELKKICFAGFTEEQQQEGEALIRRLNDNMIRFMAKDDPVREGREE